MKLKENNADKFGVTLLPFREKLRELPPTPQTVVMEGMSVEQYKRVKTCLLVTIFQKLE